MTTRKSPRSAVEPMCDLPDDIRVPRPLADRLRRPEEGANAASISIQELLCLLEPDAHLLLLMLVCTPFLLPLPSMGLSSPAGIMVASVGLTMLLGTRPWLPGFLLRRRISFVLALRCLTGADRLLANRWLRIRPRFSLLLHGPMRRGIGISLIVGGLLLSLPLPIPFSNAVPTVSIMLLCVGVVFGDGLVVLAGHLVCGVTCGIFGLMGGMLWQMVLRAAAWVV